MYYTVQMEMQDGWSNYSSYFLRERASSDAQYLQKNGVPSRVVILQEPHIIEEFPVHESNN